MYVMIGKGKINIRVMLTNKILFTPLQSYTGSCCGKLPEYYYVSRPTVVAF